MALLARMVASPLAIEVRRGQSRRSRAFSATGASRRAGTSQSSSARARRGDRSRGRGRRSTNCVVHSVSGGSIAAALDLVKRAPRGLTRRRGRDRRRPHARRREVRGEPGGLADGLGRDEPRPRRDRLARRLPRHDEGRKGSYGVHIPIAVVVDLDYVRRSPPEQLRSGIGDALSNLSALADWKLAASDRGEPIDGLAAALARSGAESLLAPRRHSRRRPSSEPSQRRWSSAASRWRWPARAGPAAARATRSRTRSTPSIPERASHGEQVAVGALFASFLREDGLFELLDRAFSVMESPGSHRTSA